MGSLAAREGIAAGLGKGYPALMRARKALASQSSGASQLVGAIPSHLQSDAGLLYERLRWRRRNNLDAGAIEILNRSPNASAMHSPKEWWRERHILARRFIEQKQYQKAYNLVRKHKQVDGFSLAQDDRFSALNFPIFPTKRMFLLFVENALALFFLCAFFCRFLH